MIHRSLFSEALATRCSVQYRPYETLGIELH